MPLQQATVLIVDDAMDNIEALGDLLSTHYRVKVATDGEKALKAARTEPLPNLILLDIIMPGMDGYAVCRRLKKNPVTHHIPVIFVTAVDEVEDEAHGFAMGAIDYITKPISPPIVHARVRTHLALYDQRRELEKQVRERTHELSRTRLQIIQRLGRAAEYRDNETGRHVIRIGLLSRLLGLKAGMNEATADVLLHAAMMHDVGKIGIPDRILLKPGALDEDEWRIMKSHPQFGAEIIGEDPSELLRMASTAALNHHEKWNGLGYPNGLSGETIPLCARIVAIVDVFDALMSERPYKKAWPLEVVLDFIKRESGQHFDPTLISLFLDILPDVLAIQQQYRD